MEQILKITETLMKHLPEVIVVLSVFVEVTPIKINPITSLLRYFGKVMNKDTIDKINELYEVIDDNEIEHLRWEILEFANSCRQHHKHTYDEFIHIIEANKSYHKILEKRGLSNGQIDLEYDYIEDIFKKCQKENSFL